MCINVKLFRNRGNNWALVFYVDFTVIIDYNLRHITNWLLEAVTKLPWRNDRATYDVGEEKGDKTDIYVPLK